jgi:hypothetical protein
MRRICGSQRRSAGSARGTRAQNQPDCQRHDCDTADAVRVCAVCVDKNIEVRRDSDCRRRRQQPDGESRAAAESIDEERSGDTAKRMANRGRHSAGRSLQYFVTFFKQTVAESATAIGRE